MDMLQMNTKRKKRKTRKCLDELRKRSKNSITGNSSQMKVPGACGFSNVNIVRQGSNCITSNRLTLNMFAKAVRSETITRPLLCDAKEAPILDIKSPIISPLKIMVDSKSSGKSTPEVCNEPDIQRNDFDKYLHDSENSSESMILFSPMPKEEMPTCKESANDETVSTITSSSRSVEDFGYHLYEELMEDIPLYLRRNLPNLTKDDVIDKTKSSLQKMIFENLQEHETHNPTDDPCVKHNILISDKSCTSNEIIVHPMDYIKIGWRQSYQQSCHESSPSNADTSHPQTPHTLCSPEASTQLQSVLPYTPDYEYFPHRLNE